MLQNFVTPSQNTVHETDGAYADYFYFCVHDVIGTYHHAARCENRPAPFPTECRKRRLNLGYN